MVVSDWMGIDPHSFEDLILTDNVQFYYYEPFSEIALHFPTIRSLWAKCRYSFALLLCSGVLYISSMLCRDTTSMHNGSLHIQLTNQIDQ